MSALHELLSYVLGFDPRKEREKHVEKAKRDCIENTESHERFREKLKGEDPLKELLRHIRPTYQNGHDDDDGLH